VAGEVLPLAIVRQRLGWGHKTAAKALREGLPAVEFGRCKYVLGADVIRFFERLRQEQQSNGIGGPDE
jgi:hypothetical protein